MTSFQTVLERWRAAQVTELDIIRIFQDGEIFP